MRNCMLISLSAAVLALVWNSRELPAQETPTASPIHLVGHEDTALLARVHQVIDDWDPRKIRNPYVSRLESTGADGKVRMRGSLKREDLVEFIADVDAAEALGKAFFWEMQAGSDFQRLEGGRFAGTACASCHYRFGADARNGYTTRIPYVVWERYDLDPKHPLEFNESQLSFDVTTQATKLIHDLGDLRIPGRRGITHRPRGDGVEIGTDGDRPSTALSLIVGSQGVEPLRFVKLNPDAPPLGNAPWRSEWSEPRKFCEGFLHHMPEWAMFVENQNDMGRRFRQITARNSPSVYNAVFADRLFHDGRAESTFNGISIFGDFDRREVLHVRRPDGSLIPVRVAITKAALASQAVGPIVNEVEMSYIGRSFPDLASKLLDAQALGYQKVADDDSHLGAFKTQAIVDDRELGLGLTYRELIQRAFRREWWDGLKQDGTNQQSVELGLANVGPGQAVPTGELMQANFSLYWGLSIMLYEASLVSNQSPFDHMMRGDGDPVQRLWEARKADLGRVDLDRSRTDHPRPYGADPPEIGSGTELFQRGFRLFLSRGCVECHSGPLLSEVYSREAAQEPKPPIAQSLEHALLPNSRADSIAIKRNAAHRRVIEQLTGRIQAIWSISEADAARLAQEFDFLREQAQGREKQLALLIKKRLEDSNLSKEHACELAQQLMTLEKTLPQHSGNRHYFGEEERIVLAEQIADPLLIERMAIPNAQVEQRRPLPISGPLARTPYAFYDLGFYNLGVAPPRYDRGIGTWNLPDLPIEKAREKVNAIADARQGPMLNIQKKLEGGYDLKNPESREELAENLRAGHVVIEKRMRRVAEVLSPEERAALGLGVESEQTQSASGVRGSAYRLKLQWQRPRPTRARVEADQTPVPRAVAPMVEQPDDPDADARTAHPRDDSWYRDLPDWNRRFPDANVGYDTLDVRRSDVHFFSRARTLVQNETAWGHRKLFVHDNELAFWGAFKTPSLRNVELTPPYMHNGRLLTLKDVVDFYDRGGDILASAELNPDKHPAMIDLDMTEEDKIALVFLLMSLTDDRVRQEQAPFDHPGITVVNGYDDQLAERWFDLPETGSNGLGGQPPRPTFPADR